MTDKDFHRNKTNSQSFAIEVIKKQNNQNSDPNQPTENEDVPVPDTANHISIGIWALGTILVVISGLYIIKRPRKN